jgi:hypothetical protein
MGGVTAEAPLNAGPNQRVPSADQLATEISQKTSTAAKERSRGGVHGFQKIVRLRDKEHRKFVKRQPCLVCGRVPADSHHLTFTQPRAFGHRVSDEFTVPVCRIHHRELHRSGDEIAWWQKLNIDPLRVALRLWQQTRPIVNSPEQRSPRAGPSPKLSEQGSSPMRRSWRTHRFRRTPIGWEEEWLLDRLTAD